MAKYPHMRAHEERIWDRYLAEYGLPAGKISYDKHLGKGIDVPPGWPEWMKLDAWALSTKRVDVITETRWAITIWEIKQRAGMSAIGQLLGYAALLEAERRIWKRVNLTLVCEELEPDMEGIFALYDIDVVELGS